MADISGFLSNLFSPGPSVASPATPPPAAPLPQDPTSPIDPTQLGSPQAQNAMTPERIKGMLGALGAGVNPNAFVPQAPKLPQAPSAPTINFPQPVGLGPSQNTAQALSQIIARLNPPKQPGMPQ